MDYLRLGIVKRIIKESCILITIHFEINLNEHFNVTRLSLVLVYLQVKHVFCSLPDFP